MPEPIDLRGLTAEETIALGESLAWPAFRGRQIFAWVQGKGITDIAAMTNLSKEQRNRLAETAIIFPLVLKEMRRSKIDDTVKFLFELADGERIETVLMLFYEKNGHKRTTCCISSQTGCPLGCKFCATGLLGAGRNLGAGELVGQIHAANVYGKKEDWPPVSRIVYMGMGEPLLNGAAVQKSLAILKHPQGLDIASRHLTVSTAGVVPEIYRLADSDHPPELAISLHAATDEKRSGLMPVNRNYPLAELLQSADYYTAQTGRRLTYEYALFRGVNDGAEDARLLGRLLKGKLAHVNLIAANCLPQAGYLPSDGETVKRFAALLEQTGLAVSIRRSRGQDIEAACGQLKSAKGA